MRRLTNILSIFLLLFFANSCKKEQSTSVNFHTDYFGLTEGRYVIYEAIEIFHDDASGVHDTNVYFLKTLVGEKYLDNAGNEGSELERFKSLDGGITWTTSDVWTAFLSNDRAELIEENQKKIKLIFAPSLSKQWNINAFNAMDEQFASYSSIHESRNIGTYVFDSTLTVQQADFFTLVDFKKQHEIYAKNIGLVQKYYKDLVIQNFDTLQPKNGTEIFYNLVSYGVE